MRFLVIRFWLAAGLFVAWIGWLLYLAFTTTRPIVLSRPQFLVSSLDVVAQVDRLEAFEVPVLDVAYPASDKTKLIGKMLKVGNLSQCAGDWQGPGAYILPLMAEAKDSYRVAPIPPSPGFPGRYPSAMRPRIYPVNERTLFQLRTIVKPETIPLPELVLD